MNYIRYENETQSLTFKDNIYYLVNIKSAIWIKLETVIIVYTIVYFKFNISEGIYNG